jgi:hypothetical protein
MSVLRRLVCLSVALSCLLAAPAAADAAGTLTVLGSVTNSSSLSGADSVAVSGKVAYVAAYWTGQLTAVDISKPSNPTILGSTPPTTSLENGTDVSIAGSYAFVTSKNRNGPCMPGPAPNCGSGSNDDGSGNSLTIVDISNPSAPHVVGTVNNTQFPNELFGSYHVAVSGRYAYVAYQGQLQGQPTGPDTSQGGFSVIDIASPSGPTVVGNIDNSSLHIPYVNALQHATSVALSGHYAFITAFYNQALTAIDIATPSNPQVVGTLNHPMSGGVPALPDPNDVQISGNYAYVASQGGSSQNQLAVVNISSPSSMSVLSTLNDPTLANAYTIRLNGSFAYIAAANSAGTVAEIDVSNPASPRLTREVQDATRLFSADGLSVDSSGGYLVAASPRSSTDPHQVYPPFINTTGTVSVIQIGSAPSNTSPPSVSGRAVQRSRLVGSLGSWAGSPTPTLTEQWLRCNAGGGACRSIAGATGSPYTLGSSDVGSTIRLAVLASNSIGSLTLQSPATAVVKADPSGRLTGVGQRRATLHVTASAPDVGTLVSKIVVSLPRGMHFAKGKHQLARGIRIFGPGGKRIAFKAALRNGSLVLTLRRAVSTADVTIHSSALSVSAALAKSVRHRRTHKLTVTITFSVTGGQSFRAALIFRV